MPSAQDVILGARVARLRDLKSEVAELRAENARLRGESAALAAHFDLALLAALDMRALPAGARFLIVDGWNLILGAKKEARDPAALRARALKWLDASPGGFAWIVYDGPRAKSLLDGRLRISYTGGGGPHRADRLVCSYLRMARLSGDISRIEVETNDRDFLDEVRRIREGS